MWEKHTLANTHTHTHTAAMMISVHCPNKECCSTRISSYLIPKHISDLIKITKPARSDSTQMAHTHALSTTHSIIPILYAAQIKIRLPSPIKASNSCRHRKKRGFKGEAEMLGQEQEEVNIDKE